jgi:hypothetical protein
MRFAKRDRNHAEVAKHLRRVGCDVLELLKPLDLLVRYRSGDVSWTEVKVTGSSAKWTAVQLRFIANTRFNVIVAKSGEEAFQKLRDRRYLSQKEKDSIAALLAIQPKDYYTPNEIEKALGV